MTSPPKPWETIGANQRMDNFNDSSRFSGISTNFDNRAVLPNMSPNIPPALPPRPYQSRSMGFGYSPYSGGMGGMGGMGYGGYSTLGNYANFGGFSNYGHGGYGYGNMYGGGYHGYNGMFGDVESRFIHLAEESTRPAFQSIQSIVGAVGSIAMMLENTFFAMTSSFRAILGVAENFGRIRTLFAQVWSAFAVFRGINWIIKKILVFLGIRTEDEFKAWAEASMNSKNQSTHDGRNSRQSSLPALLFLAIIAAVPYIVVKMLGSINSTIQGNVNDPSTWQNPMQAVAQYDFHGNSDQELSFRAQQTITIAPQNLQGDLWNSGWLLATIDNRTTGLVPVNYFKVIRNSNIPQNTAPPATLPSTSIGNNGKNNEAEDISNSKPEVDFIENPLIENVKSE